MVTLSACWRPPQCLHQVDYVLTAGPLLGLDRLAGARLIDEVDESGFVLVLEFVRLQAPAF